MHPKNRSITLSNPNANFKIVMYASNEEEVEKLVKEYEDKESNHPYAKKLVAWGEVKKVTEALAKQLTYLELDYDKKVDAEYYYVRKSDKVERIQAWKCYGREVDKNSKNNLIVHEDARSSIWCAASCIGTKYVFILKFDE